MNKYKIVWRRSIALLLAFMLFIWTLSPLFDVVSMAANVTDDSPKKVMEFDPGVFNPQTVSNIKIRWNFQYAQTASIKIYNMLDRKTPIRTLVSNKSYPGDFIINQEEWDGKDDQGNKVENGAYLVEIRPLDPNWSMHPTTGVLVATDQPTKSINIAPNLTGNKFVVYGPAPEEDLEAVEVFVKDLSATNQSSTNSKAEVGGGMWAVTVPLDRHKLYEISALKHIKKEIDGEEEIIEQPVFPNMTLYRYIVQPQDKLYVIANRFYGDGNRFRDIAKDNYLVNPGKIEPGWNLLIIEPNNYIPPLGSNTGNSEIEDGKQGGDDGTAEVGLDPINLSTGNFVYIHTDLSIPGSFPLHLVRTYNSMDQYEGILGSNWHLSFDLRLGERENGDAEIIYGDGRREVYRLQREGHYNSPSGSLNQLQKNSDETYTLMFPDQWVYHFSEGGDLTEMVDPNENITHLIYENLLLREVRNDSGYIVFQYDRLGRIIEAIDQDGRSVLYEYSRENLIAATLPNQETITYYYDDADRLVKVISPDQQGNVINVYDDRGRVIEQTDPAGGVAYLEYDEINKRTIVTDQHGNRTIHEFDDRLRLRAKTDPLGYQEFYTFNDQNKITSYTDKNGNRYDYEYDDRGNLIKAYDVFGYETSYAYNAQNKVTQIIQPDGLVTDFTYDTKGNLKSIIEPGNRQTTYDYNAKGLVTRIVYPDRSQVRLDYDTKGNLTEIIDQRGHKTQFEYNALNYVAALIDANQNRTEFEYDRMGRIKQETDPLGNTVQYEYNENGKVSAFIDQLGYKTTYAYDQADRLVGIRDPQGNQITYEYDLLGNVIGFIDANHHKTVYEYDDINRLIAISDPANEWTRFEYDQNGNLLKQINPNGGIMSFEYDALNRPIKITTPSGAITKYEYDPMGRLEKVIDALTQVTTYMYDDYGRLESIIDPMGYATSFSYNEMNRVETFTNQNDGVWQMSYNPAGQIAEMINPLGHTQNLEYDPNGNLIKQIDPMGHVTRFTYDTLDRIKTIVDPLGNRQEYSYTKRGQLQSFIDENGHPNHYRYDSAGRLVQVIDAKGNRTDYAYDGFGNLTEVHMYQGIDRDTRNRLTDSSFDAMMLDHATVTEDVYLNLALSVSEDVYQLTFSQLDFGTAVQSTYYNYDERNLLQQVRDAQGHVTYYQYDANGNLISVKDRDGYTTHYEYDQADRLIGVQYADGKYIRYTYDLLDQLTSMSDWLGTTHFEYDPLGRITQVTDFADRVLEYRWTPTGQKEAIIYPDGSDVHYRYNALDQLTHVTDAFGQVTEYRYNPNGYVIERLLPNGSKTTYDYDALSQIRRLTEWEPSGKMMDQLSYRYDPAGNLINKTKDRYDLDDDTDGDEEWGGATYIYDSLDQLIEVITDDRKVRKYFYDTLGNRIRMEEWRDGELKDAINYEYDTLNRLVKTWEEDLIPIFTNYDSFETGDIESTVTSDVYLLQAYVAQEKDGKTYTYDKRGNLTTVRSGGKIFNQYEFDATNRLIEVINKHGDHTRYTYDGFGNRVKMIIDLKETGQGRGQNNGNNGNNGNPGNKGGNGNHYGWENGNNGNEGNPGNKGGNGNHYGWENGNNGNPGNKGGNGNHYGWENGNQGNNGGNPKPGWDHQFKRDYIETHFVVDLTSPYNNILMSYGEQSQIQRYTYGLDLISMDFQSLSDHDNGWIPRGTETTYSDQFERIYYLLDELGSTTRVIGENGKSSAHYNYDEFGRPLPEVKFDPNWPGPDNTIAYTGYEYDRYAELYYAQARYYLPEIGRFISEDPWSGSLAIPTTLNPYPYVLNNPLKYVDPTGAIYQNLFYMQDEGSGQSFIYNPTGQANTKQPHPPLSSSKTISDGGQGGENHIGWGTKIVDVGLDIIPGVGSIKSGQEALFGVNLVTGEDLTNTERVISGIGAIPGGKPAIKGGQLAIDSGKHVYKKGKDIVSNVLGKGKVSFTYDSKIAKQMNNRGWNDNLVQNTLQNPHRTQVTRDTRYRPDGTRNNDPATAYIREDGSYVVRNDRTGDIVQVSNRNDPNWVSPWD